MDEHPKWCWRSGRVGRVEPCADDGLPYKLTGCLPEESWLKVWPSGVASIKRGDKKRERWTMNGMLPSGKLT